MVHGHFLKSGSSFTLSSTSNGGGDLHVVVGAGRGCTFESDIPLGGAWIPLRGRLQLGTSSVESIGRGEISTTEPECMLRAISRGSALWVALLGGRGAWHRALAQISEFPLPEPMLLPARQVADLALRRHAVSLVRAIADGRAEPGVSALIEGVFTLQQDFAAAIDRCPGRTYVQRRQVFLRLQRVRNYIAANCYRNLENDELARLANYSPWQFIRAFRTAYGQTPHAFVIDQRLRRARRLLAASSLSIAEVAGACGFEDRCAFSRLFSERFGTSAREFRRAASPTGPRVERPEQVASRNFGNAA